MATLGKRHQESCIEDYQLMVENVRKETMNAGNEEGYEVFNKRLH